MEQKTRSEILDSSPTEEIHDQSIRPETVDKYSVTKTLDQRPWNRNPISETLDQKSKIRNPGSESPGQEPSRTVRGCITIPRMMRENMAEWCIGFLSAK